MYYKKNKKGYIKFIGTSDEEFSPKETITKINPYYVLNEIKEEKILEKYVDNIITIIIIIMIVLLTITNLISICIK